MLRQVIFSALVCSVISAVREEQRRLVPEQRRFVCAGACLAAGLSAVIWGGLAGEAAASNNKRRRMLNGEYTDNVCTQSMKIVRDNKEALADLLEHEGAGNAAAVRRIAKRVVDDCARMANNDVKMNQCVFYVSAALKLSTEVLEGVWLKAFGSHTDKMHGCGAVVRYVNFEAKKIGAVVGELEGNGAEVFVTENETTGFRRLIGSSAVGLLGAGAYLAHVCRSFDDNNDIIESAESMSFN